jgi:NAD(P)-dependent dehydrogenase (short-subunit alcohol dehydrogenase family)
LIQGKGIYQMAQPLAVIIGFGPAVGLSVARRFGREGWTLALIARRQEALNESVAQLAGEGITAHAYTADVANFSALDQMLTTIVQQHGAPGLMVYNAVQPLQGPPSSIDAEAVMQSLRVNLGGAIVATQSAAQHMSQGSTLIFTGSGLALDAFTQYFPYVGLGVGKAALRTWTLNAAAELKTQGIHVATVTIAGGGVDTDRVASLYWDLHQQIPEAWQTEVVFEG